MIRRTLARHRLAVRCWSGWVSTSRSGRSIGPRPILALHRLPDPHCANCGGKGQVLSGTPYSDEPDFDDCDCAPFLPLAKVWLPKAPGWARPLLQVRRIRRAVYSDEPPF
ncbi:hypothetical protein FHS38_006001 [Streptomyces netropsis]|uniref:Uncharacterized protein n=1 Tax=Streptomyces netropsis TaxID=55404 RepID=A0A7W7PI25_STRNE|nr:hypothetical protein [Streptomyces netropsis]MBB4889923.1 hypothetical protein [Streptomyces netropsis]